MAHPSNAEREELATKPLGQICCNTPLEQSRGGWNASVGASVGAAVPTQLLTPSQPRPFPWGVWTALEVSESPFYSCGWLAVNAQVSPAACSLCQGSLCRGAAGACGAQNASSQRAAAARCCFPLWNHQFSLPARLRSPGRHLAGTRPHIVVSWAHLRSIFPANAICWRHRASLWIPGEVAAGNAVDPGLWEWKVNWQMVAGDGGPETLPRQCVLGRGMWFPGRVDLKWLTVGGGSWCRPWREIILVLQLEKPTSSHFSVWSF